MTRAIRLLGILWLLPACAGAPGDGLDHGGGDGATGSDSGDPNDPGDPGPGDEGGDCIGVGCDEGFDPEGAGAQGIVETPEGGITLDGESAVRNHVIWIANSREGTVSRIDTRLREEVGRYRTGASSTTDPSRTTVNPNGDVVVSNRDVEGRATKFYADCPDANGDGVVQTSTGGGDVLPWMQDECFAWTVPIGAGARGSGFEIRVGLDGVVEEYVWVGATGRMFIKEIDSETGELTGREVDDVNPYGLALGPNHTLWTFGQRQDEDGGWMATTIEVLNAIDTITLERVQHDIPEFWYGITVDHEGRVWIGGSVARYDPRSDTWETPAQEVQGGGIAVDAEGNAYVGEKWPDGYGDSGPWKIDGETLETTRIPDVGGHGWAVDFDGFIWSVPTFYDDMGLPGGDVAYVTDPDTLEHVATVDGLVGPYTYSDMTGFQLVNATNPMGIYPHVFEGCGEGTTWETLSWDAIIPGMSSISFAARTGDDLETLLAQPVVELGTAPGTTSPVSIEDALTDAGLTHGSLLYLEVTLRSLDREAAPILNELRVTKRCEGMLE
jgi:hypothetical protein